MLSITYANYTGLFYVFHMPLFYNYKLNYGLDYTKYLSNSIFIFFFLSLVESLIIIIICLIFSVSSFLFYSLQNLIDNVPNLFFSTLAI